MRKKRESIPIEDNYKVGACFDCPQERRGRRDGAPVNFDVKGRVLVHCLVLKLDIPTRTDISDHTKCEHYQSTVVESGPIRKS
jgi:hypothetical protein